MENPNIAGAAMGIGLGAMASGSRGLNVSSGRFNSKIELKAWAIEFATYHGKDPREVMELFAEEYEALPLTPNNSFSMEFQKAIDSIAGMLEAFTSSKDKEEHKCSGCVCEK